MHDTMISVDLAKRVFYLHVASMTGHLKERKKLTPLQFRRYMADAPKWVGISKHAYRQQPSPHPKKRETTRKIFNGSTV